MVRNKNGLLQSKGQEQKLEECKDVVVHLVFTMDSPISLGSDCPIYAFTGVKSSNYFENMSQQICLCKMQSPSFPHAYYLWFVLFRRKRDCSLFRQWYFFTSHLFLFKHRPSSRENGSAYNCRCPVHKAQWYRLSDTEWYTVWHFLVRPQHNR